MKKKARIEKAEAQIGQASLRKSQPRPATAGALIIIALLSAGQSLGQMFQHKDLSFAQVAAGPAFESVISVTNSGAVRYVGAAHFWTGQGQSWNPQVNGVRVANSLWMVALEPGETEILRIRDDSLTAGAVMILAERASQDNFIEGNLTYSAQGGNYDSVGIAPAVALYRSVIPFEDFAAVGLALANPSLGRQASLKLRLIDEGGTERETVVQELHGRSHQARFLSEIFAAATETGKVEIESNVPILGTAVTLAEGEISSLPLLPSPVAYTVRFRYHGKTDEAEAILWAEGAFVKGYLRFLRLNGQVNANPVTYQVSGTLQEGALRLFLVGAGAQVGGQEPINTLKIEGFSFQTRSYAGGFVRVFPWLSFPLNQILGNYELIRRD